MRKLVLTGDGSHTILVPELNEHYHSVHGAVQESELVFIKNGFEYCNANPVTIFEAGFGTGLNALLTAVKSIHENRDVNYVAIEKFPLPVKIIKSLNHPDFIRRDEKKIFDAIHSCDWNVPVRICRNFTLNKITGDLTSDNISGNFDLIYFDAFGPDKQPEMWTKEVFRKISKITVSKGILVTYSAKGDVQRKLKQCGFDVVLIPGPPGKRQMIRAVKF